ncbi:MAG TPA: hypothetical protein ENJ28_05710 [Gammaproteobacteria bacterium]|nr:hypothetical protein [Gammaproteobacteria bacterium]
MNSAIEKFHELEQGVLGIVRASDVYALHIMAKIRNTEPDMAGISSILSGTKISGLNLAGNIYTKSELALLEKEGHFTNIGQQIIVATHTALESYLILKFREYYRCLVSSSDVTLIEESLKHISFRSLEDFKKLYKKFFKIHIPSFEIDYHSSDGCNFQPKNSWEALELIYKARNDIVHKGGSVEYKVASLMDSWYPFEFVRNWVASFDVNFDSYIYHNKETKLIREHKERANRCGVAI